MMALLKNHRSLFATDKCSTLSKPFPQMKINKKLDFDSFSKEDIPRSSSPDPVDLHKKLIFDDSEEDFDLSDGTSSPMKFEENNVNVVATPFTPGKNDAPLLELKDFNTSGLESNSEKFSPCRTRSGKIYTSIEKHREVKQKDNTASIMATIKSNNSMSKLPTPIFIERPQMSSRHSSGASATPKSPHIQMSHLQVQEVELNLLKKDFMNDMELDMDEPTCNEPPPLISKRPMSRLHISFGTPCHFNVGNDDDDSDVKSLLWQLQTPDNPHSPPTNEVKEMKLFDKSPMYGSSPIAPTTAPRYAPGVKFRHLLDAESNRDHSRRVSAPVGLRVSFGQPDTKTTGKDRKRKRVTNINPFTPNLMLVPLKKYNSLPEM